MKQIYIRMTIALCLCNSFSCAVNVSAAELRESKEISDDGTQGISQTEGTWFAYEDFKESLQRKEKNEQALLVVCLDASQDHIQKLISWKNSLGFRCKTLVYKGGGCKYLKDAIADELYDIDFILIVGNPSTIPSYRDITYPAYANAEVTDYIDSDVFYGMNDVDMNFTRKVVPVGRISGENSAYDALIIDRIINYEKTPVQNNDFYNSFLFTAHFEDLNTDGKEDLGDLFSAELIAKTLESDFNKKSYRVYNTNVGSTPKQFNDIYGDDSYIPSNIVNQIELGNVDPLKILNPINNGVNIWSHYGHGSKNGFANPKFDNSTTAGINNKDCLPIIMSYACNTISLTGTDENWKSSFGMVFHNILGGSSVFENGCIAYIGSVSQSTTPYAQGFAYGFFDAIWRHDNLRPKIGKFDYTQTIRDNPKTSSRLGYIINQGRYRMLESVSYKPQQSRALYNIPIFNLLGDPTMRINTTRPKKIPSPIIDKKINGDYIDIKVSADTSVGRITIFNKKDLWNYTALGSSADFRVPYSLDLGLSLTGENIIPYFDDIVEMKDLQLQDDFYTGNQSFQGKKITIGHPNYTFGSQSTVILNANIDVECEEVEIHSGLIIIDSAIDISIK